MPNKINIPCPRRSAWAWAWPWSRRAWWGAWPPSAAGSRSTGCLIDHWTRRSRSEGRPAASSPSTRQGPIWGVCAEMTSRNIAFYLLECRYRVTQLLADKVMLTSVPTHTKDIILIWNWCQHNLFGKQMCHPVELSLCRSHIWMVPSRRATAETGWSPACLPARRRWWLARRSSSWIVSS